MTQVSNSKEVDDFLTSVSELSLERLKEDQKRQRELRRNIEELRLNLDDAPYNGSNYQREAEDLSNRNSPRNHLSSHQLKSRHNEGNLDSSEEEMPPLPRRPSDTVPRLPKRPTINDTEEAPPLPRRKYHSADNDEVSFLVNLVRPVARKQTKVPPPKPSKPLSGLESESITLPKNSSGFRSFLEVENEIRTGQNDSKSPQVTADKIRKLDSAGHSLEDMSKEQVKNLHYGQKFDAAKNDKPSILPNKFDKGFSESHSELNNIVRPSATSKPPMSTKPLIPPKPSLRTYSKKDEQLLGDTIGRLKPVVPAKKPMNKFGVGANNIQAPSYGKFNKRSDFIDNLNSSPEGILTLAKLKPAKPQPPAPKYKPEAIKKLETIKSSKAVSPELKESTLNFKDHLASLIRTRTEPALISPKPASLLISRVRTDPGLDSMKFRNVEKIVHPNKSRTKGPKRKLPKKRATIVDGAKVEPALPHDISTKELGEIKDFKRKKLPPPIDKTSKQRALDNLKPRTVSGELFI